MVTQARVKKLVLDGYGSYLGMEKGSFVLRDKHGSADRYPLFENEIGEVVLKSGNLVSTGALASLGFWDVDVLVLTRRGKPVAMLKSMDDDSHVETRVSQYEALKNRKGIYVAKELVLSKIEGHNRVLAKHDLESINPVYRGRVELMKPDSLKSARRRLIPIEATCSRIYFKQIFRLFPQGLRPKSRVTFQAYDGMNNTFNLAYEVLSWKVHRALIRAKLEPFLGFLHSTAFGKPSLVCDFQELYRYLIDDFLIQFCRKLKKRDFMVKTEKVSRKRRGKREYLTGIRTREMLKELYGLFGSKVEVPRFRGGKRQTIETLINEEALLLAKFLRGERDSWVPRIALV